MRLIGVIGLLLSQFALADPFEVKGVSLGMTMAEAMTAIGAGGSCGASFDYRVPLPKNPRDIVIPENPRNFVCSKKAPGVSPLTITSTPNDTFAGNRARVWFNGVNHKVASLHVSMLKPSEFESLVAVLSGKFGTPEVVEEAVQTRMGANYTNVIAKWSSGDQFARLEKFDGSIESSRLTVWNRDWEREEEERAAAALRTKAADI